MTENKRFNCHVKFSKMPNGIMVLDYEKHGDEQTVIEDINREKAHRVMDRLNELNDENEQLREALKNSYINEICENCKYGNYSSHEVPFCGWEYDFECTKKHFGNDHWKCDGLTECDDFELDLKGGDVE